MLEALEFNIFENPGEKPCLQHRGIPPTLVFVQIFLKKNSEANSIKKLDFSLKTTSCLSTFGPLIDPIFQIFIRLIAPDSMGPTFITNALPRFC